MGVLFALPYLIYGLKKAEETEPKLSPYALKPLPNQPFTKSAMTQQFAKNSIFNFMGAATPALANLVAVPVLVNNWEKRIIHRPHLLALVGYFSLLDISATQLQPDLSPNTTALANPREPMKLSASADYLPGDRRAWHGANLWHCIAIDKKHF